MKHTLNIDRSVSNLLRFLCAMGVMVHHYQCTHKGLYPWLDIVFGTQMGYTCVAVFFFLSGYGLMESEQRSHLGAWQFFKRRFLRLYVPLMAVTLLWFAFRHFYWQRYVGWHDMWQLLWNWDDMVMWFMKVLVVWYALFYLYTFVVQKSQKWGYVFLGAATVGVFIGSTFMDWYFMPVSTPIFALGVIASKWKGRCRGWVNESLAPLCVVAGSVIVFYLFWMDTWAHGISLGIHAMGNYLMVAAIIVVCTRYSIKVKFPAVLGALSFDIYLVHYKFLEYCEKADIFITLTEFLAMAAVATVLFYLLRTRLLEGYRRPSPLAATN